MIEKREVGDFMADVDVFSGEVGVADLETDVGISEVEEAEDFGDVAVGDVDVGVVEVRVDVPFGQM